MRRRPKIAKAAVSDTEANGPLDRATKRSPLKRGNVKQTANDTGGHALINRLADAFNR